MWKQIALMNDLYSIRVDDDYDDVDCERIEIKICPIEPDSDFSKLEKIRDQFIPNSLIELNYDKEENSLFITRICSRLTHEIEESIEQWEVKPEVSIIDFLQNDQKFHLFIKQLLKLLVNDEHIKLYENLLNCANNDLSNLIKIRNKLKNNELFRLALPKLIQNQ